VILDLASEIEDLTECAPARALALAGHVLLVREIWSHTGEVPTGGDVATWTGLSRRQGCRVMADLREAGVLGLCQSHGRQDGRQGPQGDRR